MKPDRYLGSRHFWLGAMTATAVSVSGFGIFYAVTWGTVADGGRGGAIGCALTFFTFFVGRPTPERALQMRMSARGSPDVLQEEAPSDLPSALGQLQGLKSEIARLRAAVAVMLDIAAKEKLYLAAASVVSTCAWGFGDIAAKHLGAAA